VRRQRANHETDPNQRSGRTQGRRDSGCPRATWRLIARLGPARRQAHRIRCAQERRPRAFFAMLPNSTVSKTQRNYVSQPKKWLPRGMQLRNYAKLSRPAAKSDSRICAAPDAAVLDLHSGSWIDHRPSNTPPSIRRLLRPSGRHPLPLPLLMTAVPAQVCGRSRIVIVSPNPAPRDSSRGAFSSASRVLSSWRIACRSFARLRNRNRPVRRQDRRPRQSLRHRGQVRLVASIAPSNARRSTESSSQ